MNWWNCIVNVLKDRNRKANKMINDIFLVAKSRVRKWNNWDEELRFMYKNNQGHLTVFCIVFVWLRGPPSPVRIMTQVPWFMYQIWLGPSGGIYHPSFAPCFVVLYLNAYISTYNRWFRIFQTSRYQGI